ncbi:hypothetical protein QA641_32675 [Bradyrhizobium sp. CB1650]|uniref:hypothetical protein n=1 Tax=Bradyrhizobium sp. CB1650 TaxID=3039153 RepID=UPI0024348739|nr:hypothetical protein [Bradyrhizobium sp. CB1650]WGD50318.1 hypothetical protein QA641_32675 [Bradyrhizobium sp. CB1650]
MSSISIVKQSAINGVLVAAGVALFGAPAPVFAAGKQNNVDVFPDLQVDASVKNDKNYVATPVPAQNRALELTSRLPWQAPIGHRQPRRADVPPPEVLSTWERQERRLDAELDRKLIICRGC